MDIPAEENANLHEENVMRSSHESYQSSSAVKETVEENKPLVYDNTPDPVTNKDRSPESIPHYQDTTINTFNLEEVRDIVEAKAENNDSDAMPVTKIDLEEIQDSTNISESVSTEEHRQVVSQDASSDLQVAGQINAPSSEQVPQGEKETQSNEYASEYMLEHHTENVYMPEQAREQVSSVSPEQAYSTEIISDDSHDNKREYEKVQVEKPTVLEDVPEKVVDNFVSDYQTELEQEENMNTSYEDPAEKSYDQVPADENEQGAFTIDLTSSNNGSEICNVEKSGNTVNEIDDQNVNESTSNEVYVSDTSINEDGTVEGITNDIAEAESANLPIEHIAEGVEDVEMAQVTDPLSENVESYAIPDDLEVTVQDGGYTIVESPGLLQISTNQNVDTNTDGTLVLLENYEQSEEGSLAELADEPDETYITELRSQSESRQSTSSQSSEVKPRRGRKPTYEIPMHVLGHDISKPVESVTNGRAIPKPRLGVKVPYRNLTSQIVSKAEIEKEIMERARLKQEQASSRGDVLFARKLTQRLARKIAPSPDRPRRVTALVKSSEPVATPQSKPSQPKVAERKETEVASSQSNSMIENDSDLLAILEGEGEEMPVLPKEIPQPQIDESNLKMLEREIALQQLQELPHQTPKQRIFRGRQVKTEVKAPVLIAEASALSKLKSTDKTASAAKQTSTSTSQPSQPLSNKENTTSKQPIAKEGSSVSPRKEQSSNDVTSPKRQPIEIEPQVKVNMVLKTYSRKRKTIDLPESFPESPVPKRAMLEENDIKAEKPEPASTTDVYVTKSSRVIKKKVIWDPDEVQSRSPKSASRPEVQTAKIVVIKSAKPADKNLNIEKVADKKPASEKVAKEKPVEKKNNEKVQSKRILNEKAASPVEKKALAVKADSPKAGAGKHLMKNKKLRSEVDRLLMDEGAVKMLYDLKNNDETAARKKKDVYSVEKAHKEIIKKANQIKNDLEQHTSNESPKSLRKKEAALTPSPVKPVQITALTERKMSKDSTRSSVHTPPGSPAYSFPHSQSSMLVRRRSSSSISSSDEIDTNEETRVTKKKSASSSSDTPKPKKVKKVEEVKESVEPEIPDVQSTPKPAKPTIAENKLNQYKSFTIKKLNRHATINLNYTNEKCYCTVQVLEELTAALKKIAKDKDCNVVSITSNSKAFCLGLDYASLLSEDEDVRRSFATELAEGVRDFLLCLLNFPKVLVAGIQGDCIGLGVTMLPLFDMVIASDTATFSTPYASLGCMAEAGFLLASPNLTNHGLAAELLFTTQKLTADDAFRRGLISRLCWPEKYNETLKNLLISIAKGSKQCLEATKKQLRRHVVQTTEAAIKSDTKLLIEHWISPECQKNFARVSENGN